MQGPPTDFTLIAEGKEFPVHKVLLFCYSDVLYKMSTNTAFVECQTGRAELKDVKACHVKAMVEHMYDKHYTCRTYSSKSPTNGSAVEKPGTVEFEMAMAILADKYNVGCLKNEVEARICERLRRAVPDAEEFATLVNKIHDNEDISENALESIVIIAADRLESMYFATDSPDSLFETRPDFAISVLKNLVKRCGEDLERAKKREEARQRARDAGEAYDHNVW